MKLQAESPGGAEHTDSPVRAESLWELQPFPSCPPLPPCPGKESPLNPSITEQIPAAFCPGLLTAVGALRAGLLCACASCLGPWVLGGCWAFPFVLRDWLA